MLIVLRYMRGVILSKTYSIPGCRRSRGWTQWPQQRQTWGCTWLWCELDIRKQLIDNIRALSKVKLTLQEVGMAVRNAATHNKAGLTTSLFKIFLAAVCILIVIDVVVKLDILANENVFDYIRNWTTLALKWRPTRPLTVNTQIFMQSQTFQLVNVSW